MDRHQPNDKRTWLSEQLASELRSRSNRANLHVIVGVVANDEGTTDFSVTTASRTLISSMQARDTRLV
jgi:hypothetical protein